MNIQHRFTSSIATQEILQQIETLTKATERSVVYSLSTDIIQKVQTSSDLKLEDKAIIAKKTDDIVSDYYKTHSFVSRVYNFIVTKIFRQHSDYDLVDSLQQINFNMLLMKEALESNNSKVLAEVLKKGLSPNVFIEVSREVLPHVYTIIRKEPALLIAAKRGNIEAMNTLIEAGADVNLIMSLEDFSPNDNVYSYAPRYTPESRTILRYLAKMPETDRTYAAIHRLMECPEVKNIPLSLQHIVENNSLRTLRMILEKGIDPNKKDKDVTANPIERTKSVEALELLSQHGAYIDNESEIFYHWTEGINSSTKTQGIKWLLAHHVKPDGGNGMYANGRYMGMDANGVHALKELTRFSENEQDEQIDLFFKTLEQNKSTGFYKMKFFEFLTFDNKEYKICKDFSFKILQEVKDPQKLLEYKRILLTGTDWVTPEIMAADSDFQKLKMQIDVETGKNH